MRREVFFKEFECPFRIDSEGLLNHAYNLLNALQSRVLRTTARLQSVHGTHCGLGTTVFSHISRRILTYELLGAVLMNSFADLLCFAFAWVFCELNPDGGCWCPINDLSRWLSRREQMALNMAYKRLTRNASVRCLRFPTFTRSMRRGGSIKIKVSLPRAKPSRGFLCSAHGVVSMLNKVLSDETLVCRSSHSRQ